eukprot:8163154-Alexandrium_andersonii.AAC.1
MSASLVGSEMCIRDSPPLFCANGLASPPPEGARCRKGSSRRKHEERERAVSYTHLTLPTICSV